MKLYKLELLYSFPAKTRLLDYRWAIKLEAPWKPKKSKKCSSKKIVGHLGEVQEQEQCQIGINLQNINKILT